MGMTKELGVKLFGRGFLACYTEYNKAMAIIRDKSAYNDEAAECWKQALEAWEARWNEGMKDAVWCLRNGETWEGA